MKINESILTLFSLCSIIFTTQSNEILKQSLNNLTHSLTILEKNLKQQKLSSKTEKEKGAEQLSPSEVSENYFDQLTPELKQITLLNMIPATINTSAQFIEIIQKITALAQTNKENYKVLSNPAIMRPVIKKLFESLTPKKFNEITRVIKGKKIRLLPIIGNIFRFAKTTPIQDSQRKAAVEKTIKDFINAGLKPKLFIGPMNLFHYALFHNMPELVQLMIQRGADVNMPDKSEYKTVPLNIAFQKSLELTLLLIEQENFNATHISSLDRIISPLTIEKHALQLQKILLKLVEKGLDPNIEIKYFRPKPLLTFAITLYDILDDKNLTLIELLLQKGANIDEEYFESPGGNYGTNRPRTPLQDAQDYPAIYDLFMEYKEKREKKQREEAK